MKNLIIVGLGRTAMHVYSFVKYHNLYNVIGFAVNEKYKNCETFNGLPVFSLEHLEKECSDNDFCLFIAVLWNRLNSERKEIYDYCKGKGYTLANLISPTAMIRSEILGDNCWIHDYVVIQNNAHIASDVLIMAYTLIGANTTIEPHCFFGARSLLGGGSIVGEQCFIGLNATIFDDTIIGRKCIIGACSAVKRNVPDFSKYATLSDNINLKEYTEEDIENKLIFSLNKR